MKQLDIIIPHERLDEVNKILYTRKVGGMLFYDIKGRGKAKREPVPETVRAYRTGRTYVPEFGTRTKIEVLVPDSVAQQIVQDVLESLSTGAASDGKIFVEDISEAYDIGSKQSGEIAL